MKKLSVLALSALATLALGACQIKVDDKPANDFQIVRESDYQAALEKVSRSEKELNEIGFKFVTGTEEDTGLPTEVFDMSYLQTVRATKDMKTDAATVAVMKDERLELETYANRANQFLNNYQEQINIQKADGTTELSKTHPEQRTILSRRLKLIGKTVAKWTNTINEKEKPLATPGSNQ